MEIWIATGSKKQLKKQYPFLRTYGIIDVKEIANSLGYESSENLDDHCSFVLNTEIQKRLQSLNTSRRFYRVLFIVEKAREELAYDLLDFCAQNNLKYECIYMKMEDEFLLICKSY